MKVVRHRFSPLPIDAKRLVVVVVCVLHVVVLVASKDCRCSNGLHGIHVYPNRRANWGSGSCWKNHRGRCYCCERGRGSCCSYHRPRLFNAFRRCFWELFAEVILIWNVDTIRYAKIFRLSWIADFGSCSNTVAAYGWTFPIFVTLETFFYLTNFRASVPWNSIRVITSLF